MTDELPPPPKIDWLRQNTLYRKLFDRLWRYRLQTLGVDGLRHIGRACASIIGVRAPEVHVEDTVVQYAGTKLTVQVCDVIARQLAARLDDLSVSPLLRSTKIAGAGWHLLEIYELKTQEKFGKAGVATKLYVLSGQLAGQYLTPWLHENLLSYLAYQALGFTRRTNYDYEPQLLVGLRCWVYLREKEEQTEIVEWAKDAMTDKHNRQILRLRMRFDVDLDSVSEKLAQQYSCPSEFDHYCADCHELVAACPASPFRAHRGVDGADTSYNKSNRSGSGAGDTSTAAQRAAGVCDEDRSEVDPPGDD